MATDITGPVWKWNSRNLHPSNALAFILNFFQRNEFIYGQSVAESKSANDVGAVTFTRSLSLEWDSHFGTV
jgi:hypothetical protein